MELDSLKQQENTDKLKELLTEMPTAQVAEFLSEKTEDEMIDYLKLLDYETIGRLFSDFDQETRLNLFRKIDRARFARIFKHIFSDVRADLYQELSIQEQTEFLPYLEKSVREDVISLSAYPPETAGGIMTTDFATVMIDMTAEQAIAKLRTDAPSKKMIYYLYVVNDNMKLQGILSLKDLVFSKPQELVKDLINEFFVYSTVYEDREKVAKKVEKYDLVAIPVLNDYQQLVGIVHHDDALDVIRAEHTEDMEKFMGIVPTEDDLGYMDTSSFYHFKKRILWIIFLAGIGLISGMIIQHYQHVLESLIVLALYMPMMASTGGNSGSQAATVVIRALALGEISDSDFFKIVFKEARISFLLSICIAGLTFFKITFLTTQENIPTDINLMYLAFVISVAIAFQVITSAMIGAGLPLFVKRLGGDPAVAASPAITTIVDITGLLLYFGVVSFSLSLIGIHF
ncbi:MAG: magnesium transporter [Halobacteriovoraceae bacterium]|nr:magnesium transporter [Halobacteriovoraceae bacterium]